MRIHSAIARLLLVVAALGAAEPRLAAQTVDTTTAPPAPIGTSFDADAISDLPLTASILTLGATAEPATISDRVDSGGVTTGEAARIGAHGASPTATVFQIGHTEVSDPNGTGTPMIMPGVLAWERADIHTAQLPIDVSGPGTVFNLVPKRAGAAWGGRVEGILGPSGWVAGSETTAPPIARAAGWAHGGLFASGPVTPHGLGLSLALDWTRGFRTDRANATRIGGSLASLFAHVESTPTDADLIRAFAWVERANAPFGNRVAFARTFGTRHDRGINAELDWNHRLADGTTAEAFATFGTRGRSVDETPAAPIVIERLFDGPVDQLLYPGIGTEGRWSAGARLTPGATLSAGGRHHLRGGIEVAAEAADVRAAITGTIGELVNGLPARVWQFDRGGESSWRSTQLSLYAADEVTVLPRLTASAGLRFESLTGSSAGAATSVAWRNWMPRAAIRWAMFDTAHIAMHASFSRYMSHLPLSWLAYSDPNAPSGRVYAWNGGNSDAVPAGAALGPVVSLVGPGLGGRPDLVTIDPGLRRPYTDEFVLGWDSRPNPRLSIHLTSIVRRQKQNVRVVNVGAPLSAYGIVTVPDPGLDLAGTADDQLLVAYDRRPASFGADRYLLTNPPGEYASFAGVEMGADWRAPRVFLSAGATAGRTVGYAGYRGFHAAENDQDIPGELFVNPNAFSFSHGRLFVDRGYTIKVANTLRLPRDVRLGIAARYQDGQPFSRMVLFPGLHQGTEFVRAFPGGLSRFTFTMTVDTRLQKRFAIGGGRHLDAILDAYNLFNQALEIEEYSVTGMTLRSPTTISAVQPPRAVHVGLRIDF